MLKNFFVLFVSVMLLASFTFSQQDKSGTKSTKNKTTKSDTTRHKMKSEGKEKMKSEGKEMRMDKDSFVMKAASGGLMEVELGRYASNNASSQKVKDFGTMMVNDHSKANDELSSILKNQNMTAPTTMMSKEKKMVDKLTKLQGDKFDKEYMKEMVKDHKKDVKDFEKASKKEKNNDIKGWVDKTLPTLKHHLDVAQDIEKNLK